MRSAAEVSEITVCVECDSSVLKLADKLALVLVTLLCECLESLLLRNLSPYECILLTCKLDHLFLDRLKVCLYKRLSAKINIIIETCLNRWSDTELHSRIKSLESRSKKV